MVNSSSQIIRRQQAPAPKRTTSDASDGNAYNRKARKIHTSVCEDDKVAADSAPQIEEENHMFDPFCDPAKPKKLKFSDISGAAFNIKGGVHRTPCTRSDQLSKLFGLELYLKKEFLQVTGSFKERGARFALLKLSKEEKERGVIAASAGNHALALCYHGQSLNVPVTVVMPVTAPLMKISLCRSYGATVIVNGDNLQKAKENAMKIASEKEMIYINGYDHPDVLAGQGTLGLEILEQVDDLDAVIVPVGGGGLIAGVALALKTLKPKIIVIGAEAEKCASFKNALAVGKPVRTASGATLADGLAVPIVGVNAVHTALPIVDEMVTVSEDSIAIAILRLIEMEKVVVEGAGAVGLAAFVEGKVSHLKGKKVVTLLTGGNIDTTVLGRTIDRGLAVDSRLIRFDVVVSDRPGGIAELTTLLSQAGASIKDIVHERAWLSMDVFSVRVLVMVETHDHEHALQLEKLLRNRYKQVNFLRNSATKEMPLRTA